MTRQGKLAGIVLITVFIVGMSAGVALGVPNGNVRLDGISLLAAFVSFAVVGALIVARRPENACGWVFSAIGLLAGTGFAAQEYAEYALVTRPGSLPLPEWAAWFASWYWFPLIGLAFLFITLLFPTGHPPSPRWRPLLWAAMVNLAAFTVLASLNPSLKLQDERSYTVANPIGVAAVGNVEKSAIGAIVFVIFMLMIVAAFVSLVVRFRRSRGDERQQLKWFTYGSALVVVLIIADEILRNLELPESMFGIVVALPPIAAGIAILKYRLYDIDLIINRTLVYGAMTILLGLIYLAGTFVLGGALRSLAGQTDEGLAVAASTLAVAALFRPARARIQGFIDRRFYRRKYDAAQTLEAFSARLRDEVDLDSLRADLLGVVSETMQPAHASLWVRSGETLR